MCKKKIVWIDHKELPLGHLYKVFTKFIPRLLVLVLSIIGFISIMHIIFY